MRLLFFGTYDAARHARVQVLIDGCRAHGDTVDECNVPLGFSTAERVAMARQPWRAVALLVRVVRAWRELWRRARRLGRYDAVVVGYLGHLDVHLARRLFRDTPIVLDYFISLADTLDDRRIGLPPVRALARAVDKAATKAADVVLVDTEAHAELVYAPPRRGLVVAVPIGAPDWWVRPLRTLEPEPLRVVFFGLFTPLQGAPFVGRAIRALADLDDVRFTMVGGGQDVAEVRAIVGDDPRVTWHDWVEAQALPDLVAGHHVCLGIFGTSGKARRVVPNKAYQGAVAGCAIVTSDTAPQRAAFGDGAVYVPPGDADALAAALRALAADPARVDALRRAAYDTGRGKFLPEPAVRPLRERLR